MTSNLKIPPVPDPTVAAARQRDAMERIEGDIQPAIASASSLGKTRDIPPQQAQRAAEMATRVMSSSFSQVRTSRLASALSMQSRSNPDEVGSEISMIRASDLAPERLGFIWSGRIARGKLTILVGDPGLRKSLLAAHLAAVVSGGPVWAPDERRRLKDP